MRLLALVAVAAALTGAAQAAPDGFTYAPVLEPAVTFVVGHPVPVLCAKNLTVWENAKVGAADGAWGFYDPAQNAIYIHPNGCRILRSEARGKKLTDRMTLQAGFVTTLVHESLHATGLSNEGIVECDAMHRTPGVAVRFFHVKPGKQLRAFMAAAWIVHDSTPPEYQAVC